EFGHGELCPGRAAVVALVGAVGGFHLAQQGVHFGNGERTVGAHGAVAGHGGEQLVAPRGDDVGGGHVFELGEYRAGQLADVGAGEQRWYGAHRQGGRAGGGDFETHAGERVGAGFGGGHLACGH